jgi:alanyl-tRNA synthetase
MFLRYFEQHGHKIVHSSSLVPANDPTLLFTNAGMNQFKDVFLGIERREYNKATSSQKCVRAGGKHNDLENVGFTNRHHTFFEMLGNFSFGDYFKKDAIEYAWELVTSEKWYGIPKDRLYVTIFKGEQGIARDDEAYEHWRAVLEKDGVPLDRIFEMGMKDNFWMMGDTGPCGPCSELHYDMGPEASDAGHTDCQFGCECGRYVEIWNLVFMQFDRKIYYSCPDHPHRAELHPFVCDVEVDHKSCRKDARPNGEFRLDPLPKPSIDTGAGLERVTAVMQGVISNYDTDLFTPLIKRAAELTGTSLEKESKKEDVEQSHKQAASLRVIADHARASTFLISDGVFPSNEGRGYVLRKIMRRAMNHGRMLGARKPFLYQMVDAVRDVMQGAYPELVQGAWRVSSVIQHAEIRFNNILGVGLDHIQVAIHDAKVRAFDVAIRETAAANDIKLEEGVILKAADEFARGNFFWEGARVFFDDAWQIFVRAAQTVRVTFPGESAFKLYDTYGLPYDFIEDICRDQGVIFDTTGFDTAMEEQRARARASWKGGSKATASPLYQSLPRTFFEGYHKTLSTGCEVLAIIKPNNGTGIGVQELKPGDRGEIVLDHTPFYADAGGQVGDVGWLYGEDHNTLVAEVEGATYPVQGVRAHRVVARQAIHVGDKVDAMVNDEVRRSTMRNHTGTHLLHAALRNVLGTHVKQAGSLVDPGHLRFDFSHFASVDDEELQDIEDLANKEVLRNDRVEVIEDVPIDVAVNEYKAMALFGEKYGDRVRVIRIGDFSTELCGGTHTAATGEIGLIKILKEGSVSSGVRRLEAVTGEGSLRHFRKDHQLENVVSTLVHPLQRKTGAAEGPDARGDDESPAEALKRELERREDELKKLRKDLEQARMKSATSSVSSATENVREIKGVKVLATRADNLERPQLRTLVDNLRNKLGSGVAVLGSVSDGKVALIVGVTKDLTSRVQAGKIIAEVAKKVGGSGGGRPDMAEAGGKDPAALDSALAASYGVVEGLLK